MTGASFHNQPSRILLLDDNSFGLSARKSVLEELGHHVTTSCLPVEALDLCAQQAFDVIVTDYRMPLMNGVEFIGRLREQSILVPVVLVSGFTETLGLNEQNTGADFVIQKSAHEVTHLIRAINRLLRKPALKKPAVSQKTLTRSKRKSTGAG